MASHHNNLYLDNVTVKCENGKLNPTNLGSAVINKNCSGFHHFVMMVLSYNATLQLCLSGLAS
jgi:hypothetical protein